MPVKPLLKFNWLKKVTWPTGWGGGEICPCSIQGDTTGHVATVRTVTLLGKWDLVYNRNPRMDSPGGKERGQ